MQAGQKQVVDQLRVALKQVKARKDKAKVKSDDFLYNTANLSRTDLNSPNNLYVQSIYSNA